MPATLLLLVLGVVTSLAGPYPPAAGIDGSTAIHSSSNAFVSWATGWTNYVVGSDCDAEWQTPDYALGKPEGNAYDIVCLGRGGEITLTFDPPIENGPGWDFAVFENTFESAFLELAYVEVSSDGSNFVRFASDSLTVNPVPGFGYLDPTDVDGFAGKYLQGYGTPFDLDHLLDETELLDHTRVTHLRLMDCVGDGSALDSDGDPIYDPYPTLQSAGFDLDGVGVIHYAMECRVDLDSSEPAVEWRALPNRIYQAQYADFRAPGTWSNIGEAVVGDGTWHSVEIGTNQSGRMFRVMRGPLP